jgi:crotonobetainyl-CoA:carnitine CoA-transferase CaiB-like acyl-CoA transferase
VEEIETEDDVARPLRGTKAVDFGTIIAGPYVGLLLAELGAEVVKVERPPLGDEYRFAHGGRGGSAYPAYNRGQRSLAVDLRHPEGQEIVEKLIVGSDIVIDNFRPGVIERLGFDRTTIKQMNPGIITVSISTFGSQGPLGLLPGFDPVIQAMSGMMRAQGGSDEDNSPVFLTVPINDVMAAVLSTFGVCLAMLVRRKTGEGQGVSVPLAAVSCLVQSEQLVRVAEGETSVLGGRDFPGPSPLQRFYATSDGFIRLEGSGDEARRALLAVGIAERDIPSKYDEEFLVDRLSMKIAGLSTDEAVDRLSAVAVAVVRVRTYGAVAQDETLIRQGVIDLMKTDVVESWESFGPGRGHFVPGSQVSPLRRAPEFGEHSREILAELGWERTHIEELIGDKVVIANDEGIENDSVN